MADHQSTHYSAETELKWYEYWEERGYFNSDPDDRIPFSIVIPPPNVTGVLHMGHMLNITVQDVLIRHARMRGFNACWVPGTDHASIATEAKVVRWLREEHGLSKGDLGREKFMEYAWEWKEKYGGIILEQLRKLGASCDWRRTAFTMDDIRYKSVIKAFVDLYNKDLLYRAKRMVHWDPQAKTVLSNEEVIYNEENGGLYSVKYFLEDKSDFITIATTRPETILADAAIAVHPDDERYSKFIGKKVLVPLVDRIIPVVVDDYVDPDFGTGALKITPAHDPNDYEVGKRHGLEVIDIFTEEGKLNETAQFFVGEDRFEARISMKNALKDAGLLHKVENYRHKIGRSERTNAIVEPRLSLQWYVRMEKLAKPALDAVNSGEVKLHPKNQLNLYRHWMENIRDWCISRQLWWGQRIPAYYYKDEVVVSESAEEALIQMQKITGDDSLTSGDLRQDEDVLDTWFSSWLWPFSVFMKEDGDSTDLDYYYPTTVLVTGWDIIFLWVARMIMAGLEWKSEAPFADVYFTGMVRDKQRRKMSKSLGNSPDTLALINQYGADGVRFGMLSCSPAGGDLLFDEKLCEQGSKFCNKIWNALRLIQSWTPEDKSANDKELLAIKWIHNKLNIRLSEIEQQYARFRLSELLIKIYSLIWDDFCSWYLEMIKPHADEKISKTTLEETKLILSKLMSILHPFMPFVTEEVWHKLGRDGDCMVSHYPEPGEVNNELNADIDHLMSTVSSIRDLRNQHGIKAREKLQLSAKDAQRTRSLFARSGYKDLLQDMASLESVDVVNDQPEATLTFLVDKEKFFLHADIQVDSDEERDRLKKDLEYYEGFIAGVQKKLSNDGFVNNAPPAVVEKERKKLADGQERLSRIRESLDALN